MYASELFQETDIVLIQQTHVINLILKQRNTLKANAKSKSGIPVRVNAEHLQHMGMDHAAAQDFNPARTLTEPAALAAALETGHLIGNIHVRRFTDFSCIHNICCINPPFYLILF